MPRWPKGKPVSLWVCDNCYTTGLGDVYISTYDRSLECMEPEGWWLTSETILCANCHESATN